MPTYRFSEDADVDVPFTSYDIRRSILGTIRVETPETWPDPPAAVEVVDETEPAAKWRCDDCGETFGSQQGLASHSRVHGNDSDEE